DADLALADLTITSKREEVIDFSYPYMTTGIGLLIKRPPYFQHGDSNDTDCKNRTMLLYPVSSVHDLPHQNEVTYGAVASGSTYSFFKHSTDETYSKIGDKMKANESVLCRSISEAKERVKNSNGKFVFFMESAAIEYISGISCDFMQLGRNIDRKSYGIAMRKDFHMKTEINMGILALQENGVLGKLKKKWFPEPKQCDNHLDAVYARNALSLVLNSLK
ncbi:glutamate receptor ionotropic, partial [Leptotrombidium deliense]